MKQKHNEIDKCMAMHAFFEREYKGNKAIIVVTDWSASSASFFEIAM